MAKTVTAIEGDSLCNIAFQNGFGDCTALREEPKNKYILDRPGDEKAQLRKGDKVTVPKMTMKEVDGATEQRHKFVKRGTLAILRFVHGSKDTAFKNDRTLTFLNVSNFITNQAGPPDGNVAFPGSGVRNFNPDADKDIDAFKVEVHDINGSGELEVELEVLKPVYDAKGKVTKHEKFPAAIRAPRELKPKASQQGATQRFRTCYLRLVVDDRDKAAANDQTLLTSDMFDAADAESKKVEILDQKVKGSYIIKTCPQNPKCRSTVILPIGQDRRRIRLAVHVLRDKPHREGGTPIVPLPDVEKRILTWFRRVYAQANIAPKLVLLQAIDPPANLVAISNDDGANADGTESFSFRINAHGKVSQTIPAVTPRAGDSPRRTANAIAALVAAPYKATVSENAARLNATSNNAKSFDIIITETSGETVKIDNVVKVDGTQTLTIGSVDPTSVPRAPFSFSGLIGTVEQRALFKNSDTKFKSADDTVDVFVVHNIDPVHVLGTATLSGHRVNSARRAVTKVRCSVLMTVRTVDSSNKFPFVFPHEFGHVAGEAGHIVNDAAGNSTAPAQLMTQFTQENNAVDGPKRIRDLPIAYNIVPGTYNLISRIRAESGNLLENW